MEEPQEKKKAGSWSKRATAILGIVLTVLNVIGLAINIPLSISNGKQMKMQIAEQEPFIETNYLTIHKSAYEVTERTKSVDSLYTEALKNYYLTDNDLLKIEYRESKSSYGEVVALAIKLDQGRMVRDVTVEYECLYSKDGLDYYVTNSRTVQALVEMEEDISGNKITRKTETVRYGDLSLGHGLILPLFEVCNLRDLEGFDPDEDNEVWSKTGTVVLVPKKLKYKSIYSNKTISRDIREMNNSAISFSLYVEGLG